jgi:D-alanyl-D-alanine carboxypeptidase/D-alanyl-D-alanine-endopeptidase (penicillin-binding protein 4)
VATGPAPAGVTSGTAVRRLLVGLLGTGAVVCLVLAFRPTAREEPVDAPELATPLWSPRRAPQAIVDGVGALRLQGALDAEVSGFDACFLVEADGNVVASANPDTPLVAASTVKVLTAAAALAELTGDFTYTTDAVAAAPPLDGVVESLWLVGSGDPVLSTSDYVSYLASDGRTVRRVTTSLDALADAVVDAGVTSIPGGVLVDDGRYDDQRYVPAWGSSYRTDEVGPLGALMVNDGWADFSGPPRQPADDPGLHAADVFTGLLEERGVDVESPPARQPAPDGAVTLAGVTSPPLRDIVGGMLSASDAVTAELLGKELAVAAGQEGTTANGVAAETAILQELGIPTEGVALGDASGLDRSDRVTCAALLGALNVAASDPRLTGLLDGLSVAGEHGILHDRLVGTPLEGRLRAKTGFLSVATALTGIVDVTRPVEFAFIGNAPSISEGTSYATRESVAEVIATFPDAPPAEVLVPAPVLPASK